VATRTRPTTTRCLPMAEEQLSAKKKSKSSSSKQARQQAANAAAIANKAKEDTTSLLCLFTFRFFVDLVGPYYHCTSGP